MVTVPLDWYTEQIERCIQDDAIEVEKGDLTTAFDNAIDELKDTAEMIADTDMEYILTQMRTRAVPQPFGLIKDHQTDKRDAEGNFPMRFVVPDNNFMSGFANVGYRMIKGILDAHGVDYSAFTINNAEHLKDCISDEQSENDTLRPGMCS